MISVLIWHFNISVIGTIFSSTSFSTGVYYQVLNSVCRLTYSGAFRAPHVSELFSDGVHHGTNRYERGNNNLDKEYSKQFDIKYQWSNDHFLALGSHHKWLFQFQIL